MVSFNDKVLTISNKVSADSPGSYKRRILLVVTGLHPQIVTETVYALATQPDDAGALFVPTEVHLITTVEGASRADLSLLSADLGWFGKLCADYHLTGIAFNRSHIHVMTHTQGQPMDDIRSAEDNRAAANFITAKVREFSNDPDCAMHVSIAGGRKTMGFYLGYALSLYGRSQDRLSHVLIDDRFEGNRDFFYPTPYPRTIYGKNNNPIDTATATVNLANIPFVSLRHGLPTALLAGNASFDETVQAARNALAAPRLELDLRGKKILAGGIVVALPPAELAFLAVFARRVSYEQVSIEAAGGKPDVWTQPYLREYQAIVGEGANFEKTKSALKNGMDEDYFSQRKSKLERHLKKALGPAAAHYCISATGGKTSRRYALDLPKKAIDIVETAVLKDKKQ